MKVIGLLSFSICLTLLAACKWLESKENHYADFKDAQAKRAVGNWIPAWFPISATDIREKHYVDNDDVWIAFDLPAYDVSILKEHCKPVAAEEEIQYPFSERVDAGWWPPVLTNSGVSSNKVEHTYLVLGCTHREGYLAIPQQKGQRTHYYWQSD